MGVPTAPFNSPGNDETSAFANKQGLWIDFYHVPTGRNVYFKAFTESIQDNYTSEWSQTPVYGRMDNIQTFQGTTRQISFELVVPSFSFDESRQNLQKIGTLASFLYPTYEQAGNALTISSAPLIKMKFLNIIMDTTGKEDDTKGNTNSREGSARRGASAEEAGLLGTLGGLNINHDFQYGAFIENQKAVYSKFFSMSFTFTVLHQHPMGWDEKKNQNSTKFPYGQRTFDPEKVNESGEGQAGGDLQNSTSGQPDAVDRDVDKVAAIIGGNAFTKGIY
jgi:hypothetical protein